MPAIVDKIALCHNPDSPGRQLRQIDAVMFHRIGPVLTAGEPAIAHAEDVATWFKLHPDQGGGDMPYTFVIPPSGTVEQALPLTVRSPHGYKWNPRAVGVALIGDFRRTPPTSEQVVACVWLGRLLNARLGRNLKVVGHTSVPDATLTPGKRCPGRYFPLASIRQQIAGSGTLITE